MFFFINQVFVRAAFVCIAFSLACASDEDDNSMFSYDHQMLDKIVKVERKVEQMDKTLKDTLESFLAILQYRKEEMQTLGDSLTGNLTDFKAILQYRQEEMQTLRVNLSDNLTEFRKEIQAIHQYRQEEMQTLGDNLSDNLTEFRKEIQAILQYRKEEMQTLEESLSDNLTEFRKKIQEIPQYRQEEMQSLGERLSVNLTEFRKEMQEMYEVPKIAFSATNPSSSTYSANQVLILRDTSLNEGSGYNGTTGEFTAPLAGMYLFSAHFCPQSQNHAYIAIVVGSKDVAHSANYVHYSAICISVSAVTNVKKEEKVFLKVTYLTKLYTDSARQSSFIGVRLSN